MYSVYILQSQLDKSFYIGYSINIDNRLNEHNFGRTRYTKKKRPWNLVYFEKYKTKKEAIIRERHLKRMKNSNLIKRLIDKDP